MPITLLVSVNHHTAELPEHPLFSSPAAPPCVQSTDSNLCFIPSNVTPDGEVSDGPGHILTYLAPDVFIHHPHVTIRPTCCAMGKRGRRTVRSGEYFRRVLRFALHEKSCVCKSPVGAAKRKNIRRARALAHSGRGILEPCLRLEVPLYIRHATDRKCVERVQRHNAILFVKNPRFVQARRDRPRCTKVRLPASTEHRTARVPCIALGGVNARSVRVDQLRLVLSGAQARKNVACVIPIRCAISSS